MSQFTPRQEHSSQPPFFNRESPPQNLLGCRGWKILPHNERRAKEWGRLKLGVREQRFLSKYFKLVTHLGLLHIYKN